MKIFSYLKTMPKRISVVAIVAAAVIVPAVAFAWGPSRTTYTVANPAKEVVFNSITDNPNYGDERNFVTIKDAANTSAGGWSDDVTVQDGKEYIVRMYVHNNAAANLNLVARNVKASSNIPTYSAKSIQIDGYISADNSNPLKVWDQVVLKNDKNFKVDYVKGSAKYYTNALINGVTLSDNVANSTGAALGYDKLDGKIPGCFQYTGVLSYKVKINVEKTPNFEIQKTVRVNGATDTTFKENATVNPGDKVDYQIYFKNTGETSLDNVIIKDTLPAGVTYVPGTTYLHNATGTRIVTDGITVGGLNIGGYAPTGDAYLKFTATIGSNNALPICGTNKLNNIAKATTVSGSKEDGATVTVTKVCPPEVKYTCDALSIKRIERTKFQFATSYSVKNATFKNITYIIRDEKGNEVERKSSTAKTLDYTRTTVGKYTVQAVVTVTVNGVDKTVTSDNCKGKFEVVKEDIPEVKYTCDALSIKRIERTKFQFATSYSVKNATFKNITYIIRDEKGNEVERKSSTAKTLDYTRTTVGKYTVQAVVTVTVNGVDKTVTSDNCKGKFEVVKEDTPAITITKKVDSVKQKQVAVGQSFTYQLVVTNNGEVNLKNAVVTDPAPAGVTLLTASTGTIANNAWTYTIPALNTGKSVSFTITATVQSYVAGELVNTACVNTPEVNPTEPTKSDDCDIATVTVVPPTPITPPTTPAELPHTGPAENIVAFLGLGTLIASIGYYRASRRALLNQ